MNPGADARKDRAKRQRLTGEKPKGLAKTFRIFMENLQNQPANRNGEKLPKQNNRNYEKPAK
ncbi:MAG TPA: hypothetical protein VGI46_04340 [Candidatus Acidoferrum sp.]|jgi:hypothetical protein